MRGTEKKDAQTSYAKNRSVTGGDSVGKGLAAHYKDQSLIPITLLKSWVWHWLL
jgi:hypothetical protein